MNATALELAGMLVATGAAAAAVLAAPGRARLIAMGIALAAAPVLVLGSVWDEPRVVDFRGSPAQIGAAVIVGGLALAALAAIFRRRPAVFAIAAFAVVPLRVPLEIGGETANLLVPLYLVIGAGVISQLGDRRPQTTARGPQTADRAVVWLRSLLALTLVLYAVQAAYSEDVANAIENIGFFLVPFAVMYALLVEVEWTTALLRRVLIAVAAVAGLCAAVAIYQWLARDLFLNPELFDANQLHVYFRANSVFFDPNILGRYLALALTALGACIAWSSDRRTAAAALAVCALLLTGLVFSFSITSFAAALAGLGMVALLHWGWRGAAAAAALGAAGLVALVIAGGTPGSDIQTDRGIDSGRSDLIEGGLVLAGLQQEDAGEPETGRPLTGYGSGSFGAAFVERIDNQARSVVSHSEPITVAAEQGAIGLVVYAGLIGAALVTLLTGGAGRTLARTAVAACFVAVLIHSLGYAGFAIDPATWALLGLGVALATRRDPADPTANIPAER